MMNALDADFRFDLDSLNKKVGRLVEGLETRSLDRSLYRRRLSEAGVRIGEVKPVAEPRKEAGFLSSDASIVKRKLRYHCMWALHCVTLYSEFDWRGHEDLLAGHGSVGYKNMKYSSLLDVGRIAPYHKTSSRLNSIRLHREYTSLSETYESLKKEGAAADYIIVDGSLYTAKKTLERRKKETGVYREHDAAFQAQENLLAKGNVVGMVEDSHAIDVAQEFGLDMTNTLFFSLILDENEYAVKEKSGINVCYVKLPKKKLDYTTEESRPLVARWEFSYPGYEKALEALVGIWATEKDLLHTQTYPMRVTDYLTRKIRVSGILDEVVGKYNLDSQYRGMREA